MEEGEISEGLASQGEMDDAAKLQKLAMMYQKVKNEHGLLKRALIGEKERAKQMVEDHSKKERQLRSAMEEIDRLGFQQETPTKRVRALQNEIASTAAPASQGSLIQSTMALPSSLYTMTTSFIPSFSSLSLSGVPLPVEPEPSVKENNNEPDVSLLSAELANKIKENERVNMDMFDLRQSFDAQKVILQSSLEETMSKLALVRKECEDKEVALTALSMESKALSSSLADMKSSRDRLEQQVGFTGSRMDSLLLEMERDLHIIQKRFTDCNRRMATSSTQDKDGGSSLRYSEVTGPSSDFLVYRKLNIIGMDILEVVCQLLWSYSEGMQLEETLLRIRAGTPTVAAASIESLPSLYAVQKERLKDVGVGLREVCSGRVPSSGIPLSHLLSQWIKDEGAVSLIKSQFMEEYCANIGISMSEERLTTSSYSTSTNSLLQSYQQLIQIILDKVSQADVPAMHVNGAVDPSPSGNDIVNAIVAVETSLMQHIKTLRALLDSEGECLSEAAGWDDARVNMMRYLQTYSALVSHARRLVSEYYVLLEAALPSAPSSTAVRGGAIGVDTDEWVVVKNSGKQLKDRSSTTRQGAIAIKAVDGRREWLDNDCKLDSLTSHLEEWKCEMEYERMQFTNLMTELILLKDAAETKSVNNIMVEVDQSLLDEIGKLRYENETLLARVKELSSMQYQHREKTEDPPSVNVIVDAEIVAPIKVVEEPSANSVDGMVAGNTTVLICPSDDDWVTQDRNMDTVLDVSSSTEDDWSSTQESSPPCAGTDSLLLGNIEDDNEQVQRVKQHYEGRIKALENLLAEKDTKVADITRHYKSASLKVKALKEEKAQQVAMLRQVKTVIQNNRENNDTMCKSYEEQIKVFTEHSLSLSEQLKTLQFSLDDLRSARVMCGTCSRWNTIGWILDNSDDGKKCSGGLHPCNFKRSLVPTALTN